MTRAARLSWEPAALGAVALLGVACENDVGVQLLPSRSTHCVDGGACPGYARALSFRGAYDRVEIPSSPQLDLPQDFAFEAWVWVRSYDGGHGVLNRWRENLGDIQLTFGTPEPLPAREFPTSELVPSHALGSWAFLSTSNWLTGVAPSLPATQSWHHLATSYGGGSFRLYVDGALVSSMPGTETVLNPASPLYLGATARHERDFDTSLGTLYWPPIDGFIAEVRLSSSDRYTASFVPEPRLEVDASTLAVWHLDEGNGGVAEDSGPSRLHGTIIGAEWALAPVRVGASKP